MLPEVGRTQVFVSYSHKDKCWLEKLTAVLAPDIRRERIDYWNDRGLEPGDRWRETIFERIRIARVAVLLVSPNFLASRFIMEEELPQILAARSDGLTILWIPLFGPLGGPAAPPEIAPIAELQAACPPGQPLAECAPSVQTAILLDVCRRISRLLNPGRVPWCLPFTSLAELFKGREEALDQLDHHVRLQGAPGTVKPQVVYGLGGIGKTRLVVEYAWRHQRDFKAFLFCSANRPDDLDRSLAALCRPDGGLDLPEQASPNQDEQRNAVVLWLQKNTDWLLILDNVDTDEGVRAAKALAARLPGGHIIITSRVTQWGHGVHMVPLDALKRDAAVALLRDSALSWRDRCPDDETQARVLADRLGCLPLALTHAAAYMQHHHQSFAAYLEDFELHFERLLAYHDNLAIEYETDLERDSGTSPTGNVQAERRQLLKTVATTFFLSFDRLAPEAKAILHGVAFLAPDPIPAAMLQQCPAEIEELVGLWCSTAGEVKTGQTVAESLAQLARYSLISRTDGMLGVHRLEQRILRSRVAREQVPRWHECVQALIHKYAPEETAESPRTWPVWEVLRPHAQFLIQSFISDEGLKPDWGLVASVECLLFGKGLYTDSLQILEDLLRVAERSAGPESKEMADRLLAYGESLRVVDRTNDASEAFRHSLQIREKLDGPESLRVADALNYLGLTHHARGELSAGQECYRRAIAIYASHDVTECRTDYAKALTNLAESVKSAGQLPEAEQLLSRAVELTADEPTHRTTPQLAIACRANLATVLAASRQVARGSRMFEEALQLLAVFPPEHPFREVVDERYCRYLCDTHQLTQAKQHYASTFSAHRPSWGSARLKREPERGLRGKLRITETTIRVGSAGSLPELPQFLPPAFLEEIRAAAELKPWAPYLLRAIRITDTDKMRFSFLFDSGTDDIAPDEHRLRCEDLVSLFVTSVALDEANLWATASGDMPEALRTTTMGGDLAAQAKDLGRFVSVAMDPGFPSGQGFHDAMRVSVGDQWNAAQEFLLELWVRPGQGRVYTYDPVAPKSASDGASGKLLQFMSEGEGGACLAEAPLELLWEWRLPSTACTGRASTNGWRACLDQAFESHVAPVVTRMINHGRLLARLRQITSCMFLATWFKQSYRYHEDVARYLETGNVDQLRSSILTIDGVATNLEDSPANIQLPEPAETVDCTCEICHAHCGELYLRVSDTCLGVSCFTRAVDSFPLQWAVECMGGATCGACQRRVGAPLLNASVAMICTSCVVSCLKSLYARQSSGAWPQETYLDALSDSPQVARRVGALWRLTHSITPECDRHAVLLQPQLLTLLVKNLGFVTPHPLSRTVRQIALDLCISFGRPLVPYLLVAQRTNEPWQLLANIVVAAGTVAADDPDVRALLLDAGCHPVAGVRLRVLGALEGKDSTWAAPLIERMGDDCEGAIRDAARRLLSKAPTLGRTS